jgi:hypothetical protein
MNGFGKRRTIDNELKPGLLDGGAKGGSEVRCESGQVGWLPGSLNTASLDAGKIEKGVDQPLQAEAVSVSDRQ